MRCMKCGKETDFEHVFCKDCLLEMEKYPVNSNIPVILPKRTEAAPAKKPSKKKAVPLEEQLVHLKSRIRLLTVLLAAMTILVAMLLYPAVKYLMEDHFLPGQNYSSIDSKTSTAEAIAEE